MNHACIRYLEFKCSRFRNWVWDQFFGSSWQEEFLLGFVWLKSFFLKIDKNLITSLLVYETLEHQIGATNQLNESVSWLFGREFLNSDWFLELYIAARLWNLRAPIKWMSLSRHLLDESFSILIGSWNCTSLLVYEILEHQSNEWVCLVTYWTRVSQFWLVLKIVKSFIAARVWNLRAPINLMSLSRLYLDESFSILIGP